MSGSTEDGRADRPQRILDAVLAALPLSRVTEARSVTVVEAWAAPDAICVVYRLRGCSCQIGLCRELDEGMPDAALVDEIASYEIGEPLGTVFDEACVGPDNVFWWDGVGAIPPQDAPRRPPHP